MRISSPAKPARAEWEIKAVSGTAAPASTRLSVMEISAKKGLSRWIDQGVDALVRDQHVGTARQDLEREPFVGGSV